MTQRNIVVEGRGEGVCVLFGVCGEGYLFVDHCSCSLYEILERMGSSRTLPLFVDK